MSRVKRGKVKHRRKKRVFKRARGFRGGRSKLFRTAVEAVNRADQFATVHRKLRKRDFRRLWITRINAAARLRGLTYSRMMAGLRLAKVEINRKILSELAVADPKAFDEIVEKARNALG
jgi:large subunit ribosomal protein L20